MCDLFFDMNLLIRFSHRLRTFAILILLLAGISLTANAKDHASKKKTDTDSKKSTSAESVAKDHHSTPKLTHADTSQPRVPIEGAFGYRLGDIFLPTKSQHPLKNSASLPAAILSHQNGITFPVYQVTPSKPIKIFHRYLIFITPKTHKICEIAGWDAYKTSEIAQKNHQLLENALKYKYHTKDGFSYLRGLSPDGKSPRSISLSATDSGDHKNQITLSYLDTKLFQQMMDELHAEESKEAGVDPSAL